MPRQRGSIVPTAPPSLVPDDESTPAGRGELYKPGSDGAEDNDQSQLGLGNSLLVPLAAKHWRWFKQETTEVVNKDKKARQKPLPPIEERATLEEPKVDNLYFHVILSKPVMLHGHGDAAFNQRKLPTQIRGWMLGQETENQDKFEHQAVDDQAKLIMVGGTDQDEVGFIEELPPFPSLSKIRAATRVHRERFLGTGFADDTLDYRRIVPTGEKLTKGEIHNITRIIADF